MLLFYGKIHLAVSLLQAAEGETEPQWPMLSLHPALHHCQRFETQKVTIVVMTVTRQTMMTMLQLTWMRACLDQIDCNMTSGIENVSVDSDVDS